MSKCTPGEAFASNTARIECAVLQGTVLFSTMIFESFAVRAICLVAASTALPSTSLLLDNVPQISSHSTSQTTGFRRRSNTHENQLGIMNSRVNIRTEEKILIPHSLNHFPQSRLKNRQFRRIPGFYSCCIRIYDRDFDMWIFQRDDCACRRS